MPTTFNNLFDSICTLENLFAAARKACLGKRRKPNADRFRLDLERQIWALREQLATGTYRPGTYRSFWIVDPKKRLISAAPFRDRVVHHALCNVIEPLWERRFISESFANRVGFGTSQARDHFAAGIRNYPFILRMDIRKFFPSIDREILKSLFRRVVRCRRTLALMDLFVDTSNAQEPVGWHFFGDDLWTPCEHPHGLPLGNQTSQLFANVYLDSLDHFVKEHLRCRHYVRYVDDLALFGSGKPTLGGWKGDIEQFLCGFRLRAHAGKSRVYRSRDGVSFLGLRFRPGTRRLAAENARRARRRVKKQVSMCRRGSLSITDLEKSWAGWRGHAEQANAQGLVEQLWRQAGEWRADGDNDVPGGSGRWLEQSISQHSVRQSEQESTG